MSETFVQLNDQLEECVALLGICNHVIAATKINNDFTTSLDLLCQYYPQLNGIDPSSVSLEGFMKITGNIIQRVYEIIKNIVARITRFIRGIFESRVRRSSTLRAKTFVIKTIRDDIVINHGDAKGLADFEILAKTIIDFKLFKERFKLFDKILTDISRVNESDIYQPISAENSKAFVANLLDLKKPENIEYGIVFDPNTNHVRFQNILVSDYHKKLRVHDLSRALTLIREYENTIPLFEKYLSLMERIRTTTKKIESWSGKIYQHKDDPNSVDQNKIGHKEFVGAIYITQELLAVTQSLLAISLNDLAKMESVTGVIARFMKAHRKSITH